jgi:Fe-S-cluster containining protein
MCCTFSETDKIDAPLFTEETRQCILREFGNENVEFESVRQLWRIKLKPIDDPNRWTCPLYERETAKCRIQRYKPFDCYTWPFYIVSCDNRIVIALLPVCPIVDGKSLGTLKQYLDQGFARHMIDTARKYPDLITEYQPEMIILYEVNDDELNVP